MKLLLLCSAGWALAAAWGWSAPSRPGALERQRRELSAFLPVLVAAASAGVASGLVGRDRASSGSGYASPAGAWIGKRIGAAGLVGVACWVTTPLPCPSESVWLMAGAVLAGGWSYVGNLPARL